MVLTGGGVVIMLSTVRVALMRLLTSFEMGREAWGR